MKGKNSEIVIITPDDGNINDNNCDDNGIGLSNHIMTSSLPILVPVPSSSLGSGDGIAVRKRVRTYSEEVIITPHSLTVSLTPDSDCYLNNQNVELNGDFKFRSRLYSGGDLRDDRSDIDGFLSGVTSNDSNWVDKRPISRR